ncbi:MAG: CPBP family intramembrane metalloprotease [Sphaerochaetaceae bacterium]|nr:CPBP family intramembrane metalloprotease [Sphaerochaetaceae bacterium]
MKIYQREIMGRSIKWILALPLAITCWIFWSVLFIPSPKEGFTTIVICQTLDRAVLLTMVLLWTKFFLKFSPKKLLTSEKEVFRKSYFVVAFTAMVVPFVLSYILWAIIEPQCFTYSLNFSTALRDFFLVLVLMAVAVLTEETIFRSYIAYVFKNEMEENKLKQLYYCIISAILFSLGHFQNPEVSSGALWSMAYYFVCALALMYVTLKTKGLECALGIHFANNIVNSIFVGYDNSVISTNTFFHHSAPISIFTFLQGSFSILIALVIVLTYIGKKGAKDL